MSETLWQSSTRLLMQPSIADRPVLPVQVLILALIISVLNCILWLTATILQIVLLSSIENNGSPYTVVCLATSWSIINLIVTTGSVYGLLRNAVKDIKGYLILSACVAVLALIIFIFHITTLNNNLADETWLGPGGFSIFTGFYVAGVTCILSPFLYSHLKSFQTEAEEKRMFLLQQHFNQQKEQQLRQLSRVGMPTPPAEREDYQQHNLTSSNASLYPVDIEQIDACSTISSSYSRNSSISDALFRSQEQEDRITYSFPPTFV